MSNFIDFKRGEHTCDDIGMSNGMTAVFISILALSGTKLAATENQKRLMVRLCEADQICGIGTVSFDVCSLPWERETLEEDKAFMLRVIEGAKNKTGWEKLDYEPSEERLFPNLDKLIRLIERVTAADIDDEKIKKWYELAEADDPINNGFPKCEKHGVFLTCLGCVVCNDPYMQ
ncbi:MAG: hypothetical protein K2N72_04540 [Oscillospiraceae bacterium]|nr:hypothetical protein [Oscillospiraceae bacterium]